MGLFYLAPAASPTREIGAAVNVREGARERRETPLERGKIAGRSSLQRPQRPRRTARRRRAHRRMVPMTTRARKHRGWKAFLLGGLAAPLGLAALTAAQPAEKVG